MGVKLGSLIEETEIDLSELSGKKVAVDGMQMLFQLLYNPFYAKRSSSNGKPGNFEVDASRRVYYHLYGWIKKAVHFYKAEILPIVVFDGRPSKYKRLTYRRSKANYKKAQAKSLEAIKTGDYGKAQKIALSKHYLFSRCVRESVALLKSCGIPVVVAPGEAEAQCALMQKKRIVDFAVSTD